LKKSKFEPFFLDGEKGRIFCLIRAPQHARKCVVFVPSFAEEMNKCRRLISDTADRLVSHDVASIVFDLFGTGDSSGAFGEAQWQDWKQDLALVCDWVDKHGFGSHSFVAMRLGCLLAAESLPLIRGSVDTTIFWQPVLRGSQFMSQFLRMRVASSMVGSGQPESMESLKDQLTQGIPIEIAGYWLSPELYGAIVKAELSQSLDDRLGYLHMFEVSPAKGPGLSMAYQRALESARARGIICSAQRVIGEPFWASTEITTNPMLSELTLQALRND